MVRGKFLEQLILLGKKRKTRYFFFLNNLQSLANLLLDLIRMSRSIPCNVADELILGVEVSVLLFLIVCFHLHYSSV